MEDNNIEQPIKEDGRKRNGGKRPGSGRPKTDKVYINKTVGVPIEIIEQAKNAGVKDGQYAGLFLSGFKKQLEALKTKKK